MIDELFSKMELFLQISHDLFIVFLITKKVKLVHTAVVNLRLVK